MRCVRQSFASKHNHLKGRATQAQPTDKFSHIGLKVRLNRAPASGGSGIQKGGWVGDEKTSRPLSHDPASASARRSFIESHYWKT